MRKLKLFLMACALMGAGTSWAQTDVTSQYITNAGFETDEAASNLSSAQTAPTGWTLTSSSGTSNTQWGTANASTTIQGYATSFSPSEGSNYFYLRCNWQIGTTLSLAQTTSELTAGVYVISFDAVTYSSNGTQPTYTFKVNDGANDLVAGTMTANKTSWTNYSYAFTLSSASTVTITAAMKPGAAGGGKHDWMLLDNMMLLYFANEEAYNDYLRQQNNLTEAAYANPIVTNFVVNGTFDNSDMSKWICTGGFSNTGRKTTEDSNAGNMNSTKPWWENWNQNAKVNKMYQTINNIPNGTYRLDITAFVNKFDASSQYVFANGSQQPLTEAAKLGATFEVYTVVTNNTVEIGLEQTTATANWMGIDNVSLRYYGAGDVINDAQNAGHKLAWEEAKNAAQEAVENEAYANVGGKELADLNAELAKAEPSTADGYDAAAEALTTATTAFISAKTIYDMVAAAGTLEYANPEKKPAITNETTAASLVTPLRAYYESHALAEGVTGAVNQTESIANANNPTNNNDWTWTGPKNNPASNEPWTDADGTNTHSYFDGGDWNAGSWTTTMSQTITIPAGKYLLTAKGRASENVTFTMSVGEASVNLPHVGNAGNVFDRGWGDASLVFESKGKGDEILIEASSAPVHEWFSISDFRLVQIEDHTLTVANEDLATAIQAADDAQNEVSELLTIIGSYADPSQGDVLYSEVVRCSEKTTLTGAISQAQNVDVNDKEAVVAATEALTTATATFLAAVPAYERAEMAVAFATFEKLGLTQNQQYQLVGSLGMKLLNPNTTAAGLVDPANTAIQGLVPYFVAAANVRVGFERGEYAPYNNVEGLQALIASETIGTNPADYTNEQISEQCLILVNYKWTQNTEDVDAIYNGTFAETGTGNNPKGWTRSNNGWGQQITGLTAEANGVAEGTTTAWYYNNNGAWQYGNDGVYAMPLAATTAYKLTFKYAKHGNDTNNWMKASVLNSKNEGLAVVEYPGANDATLYQSASAYFTTGEAGNYILSLEQNGNVHLTDVSLVKATSTNKALAEGTSYTPELAYYETVKLARPLVADKWNTFVVPFNIDNATLKEKFGEDVAVSEATLTSEYVEFTPMAEPAITANKPVIIKGTTSNEITFNNVLLKTGSATISDEGTSFVGNYESSKTLENGWYYIKDDKLKRANGTQTINAFRAYFTTGNGARLTMTIDGKEATDIEGVELNDQMNGAIYNLNGQRVDKAQKGLFIKNGKKVVVK